MSDLSAQLIAALKACANASAGAEAPLVSVSVEFVGEAADARVTAKLARKTRTLVFVTADATSPDGAPIATASSVHKIKS
ncbi:MAG TPA: acyl-CoA thioesterase domain-containing protein [Vitreimonas sp.]|uniref:acyl-CoA thioesterase domain-containing protein n=1 Tax=Vitreimonas sp. TaxID=3069702 RepID=UPI002D3592EB|nr:acyl-CoA thioesterase domain-containing protein [Vitreimonas sp.]HYD86518.1 acyl-CoA thioesterase domain-containing protein [Vitreimonas sp.]